MFEQTLYKKMQNIAASYTDPARKAVYQEAVKKFRLPYIDYHRARNYDAVFPGVVDPNQGSTSYPYDFSLPQVLTLENITVKDFPGDTVRTIPNPLAHYKFPNGSVSENEWSVSGISPNADMKTRTIRYPANRFSRWDPLTAVSAAMNEVREESIRLSLLFIENGAYSNYETYATNGTTARDQFDGQTASGSLESVHGNYHVFIGGSGHMSSVPTAAFDPIFWLHHW
jgi:tyrosinase